MKCQCKKSLNAPTESGVVVRVSGLYAKHSHSTQDGVEFIPAVFYAAASRNIGVLLRYNGKCRAWANNLYASPDAVEKLIVEFAQRYERFKNWNSKPRMGCCETAACSAKANRGKRQCTKIKST